MKKEVDNKLDDLELEIQKSEKEIP